MAASPVTAAALREALSTYANLELPGALTDPKMQEVLDRKAGVALRLMGGSVEDDGPGADAYADAVLNLAIIEVKRMLRGDDPALMSALNSEERLIQEGLQVVKGTGGGSRFFEVATGRGGG